MQLGRYTLLRHLATGGMAEVYLASASGIEGFEKLVTIKRIRQEYSCDGEFVRMFLDEARLAASLHHPNIAQVFDVGDDDGLFFAMEYIHGEDLRAIIRAVRASGQPVPFEHVIAIGAGVAAALHHAHEQRTVDGRPLGTVHRDVSPSNVLVSYDGAVKLVDFGIAKAASCSFETRAGTLKGKAPYMSPEQCLGAPLDGRSDLFSLGALLYELSTGTRAFTGDNDIAIAHRIVNEDVVAPARLRPDYPADLARVILRALRRDRDERPATARELQQELEAVARAQSFVLSALELGSYLDRLFPGRRRVHAAQAADDLRLAMELEGTGRAPLGSIQVDIDTATVVSGPTTLPRLHRPRRRSRLAWAIGVAAIAVAGGAIAAWQIADSRATAAPPAAEAAPAPESSPATAGPVQAGELEASATPATTLPPAAKPAAPRRSRARPARRASPRKRATRPPRPAAWDEDSALPPR